MLGCLLSALPRAPKRPFCKPDCSPLRYDCHEHALAERLIASLAQLVLREKAAHRDAFDATRAAEAAELRASWRRTALSESMKRQQLVTNSQIGWVDRLRG